MAEYRRPDINIRYKPLLVEDELGVFSWPLLEHALNLIRPPIVFLPLAASQLDGWNKSTDVERLILNKLENRHIRTTVTRHKASGSRGFFRIDMSERPNPWTLRPEAKRLHLDTFAADTIRFLSKCEVPQIENMLRLFTYGSRTKDLLFLQPTTSLDDASAENKSLPSNPYISFRLFTLLKYYKEANQEEWKKLVGNNKLTNIYSERTQINVPNEFLVLYTEFIRTMKRSLVKAGLLKHPKYNNFDITQIGADYTRLVLLPFMSLNSGEEMEPALADLHSQFQKDYDLSSSLKTVSYYLSRQHKIAT